MRLYLGLFINSTKNYHFEQLKEKIEDVLIYNTQQLFRKEGDNYFHTLDL